MPRGRPGGPSLARPWGRPGRPGEGRGNRAAAPQGPGLDLAAAGTTVLALGSGSGSADEGSGPGAALEEALGHESVVGGGDGAACDAETRGELSRRGDAVPGGEPAVEDGAAQLVVDARSVVAGSGERDVDVHSPSVDWPSPFGQMWPFLMVRRGARVGT